MHRKTVSSPSLTVAPSCPTKHWRPVLLWTVSDGGLREEEEENMFNIVVKIALGKDALLIVRSCSQHPYNGVLVVVVVVFSPGWRCLFTIHCFICSVCFVISINT